MTTNIILVSCVTNHLKSVTYRIISAFESRSYNMSLSNDKKVANMYIVVKIKFFD